MSSLFDSEEKKNRFAALPLAARMRPNTLEEFVGQRHFVAEGKLLRRLLAADRLGSVIFYGPPGTGKTTLAYLLARASRSIFKQLSAVSDGVKTLREILLAARERLSIERVRTLLFIDEIHRFNKAQQDVLLPEMEQGIVTLVGATTENPFFTINNALLSRSRIFQFEPLGEEDIKSLLRRAAASRERGLGQYSINLHEDALDWLAAVSDGDARRALATLEIGVLSSIDEKHPEATIEFTKELAAESMQRRIVGGDRDGDTHYDTISALIKSIRGSDPDAAIYWLARMLEGGEEVRFLARRLVILASEDVGNADPRALPLAVACAQACEMVGLPECQLNLAQTITYLACAPKSNAATTAIFSAKDDIREGRILPVPKMLRDAHYAGSEQFGHTGYKYAHDFEGGIVAADYLGVDRRYYTPTDRGFEKEISERLVKIRAVLQQAKQPEPCQVPQASPSPSSGEEKTSINEPGKEKKQKPREQKPKDQKQKTAKRARRAKEQDQ